ncbi:MAG: hypothetical protein E6J41_00750 [Chloroflexi bacterium]|nr:MAG: hypothetical protein E6J41_00750 [Chloroflexota bacterium]
MLPTFVIPANWFFTTVVELWSAGWPMPNGGERQRGGRRAGEEVLVVAVEVDVLRPVGLDGDRQGVALVRLQRVRRHLRPRDTQLEVAPLRSGALVGEQQRRADDGEHDDDRPDQADANPRRHDANLHPWTRVDARP